VPWGVDSHFDTRAQSRPAGPQSTLATAIDVLPSSGKCGSMGCRIMATRVTEGLSLSLSLCDAQRGSSVCSYRMAGATTPRCFFHESAHVHVRGFRWSALFPLAPPRRSPCLLFVVVLVRRSSRPSENGRRCVSVRAVVAVGRRRTPRSTSWWSLEATRRASPGTTRTRPARTPLQDNICSLVTGPKCRAGRRNNHPIPPRGGREATHSVHFKKLRRITPF
jgi:hypothetical protein